MPSGVVLGQVYAAFKAILAGYAPLTTLIAVKTLGGAPAIYDDGNVPQGAVFPYLTIGAGTQNPAHRLGMRTLPVHGWSGSVQVKAIGQGTETTLQAIINQVLAVLYDGRELTLAGYQASWIGESTVQPLITTVLAGVTTRELPAIIEYQAHD